MNGVDVGDFGGADDVRNIQIAVGAARRADADRLVRKAHVQGMAVGLRIDGYGPDAEFLAGGENPKSNFAAIGNQDLLEHVLGAGT